MAIMMPASDQAVLARRSEIVAALRAIVPGEGVIDTLQPALLAQTFEERNADRDRLRLLSFNPTMVVAGIHTFELFVADRPYLGDSQNISGRALSDEDGLTDSYSWTLIFDADPECDDL